MSDPKRLDFKPNWPFPELELPELDWIWDLTFSKPATSPTTSI